MDFRSNNFTTGIHPRLHHRGAAFVGLPNFLRLLHGGMNRLQAAHRLRLSINLGSHGHNSRAGFFSVIHFGVAVRIPFCSFLLTGAGAGNQQRGKNKNHEVLHWFGLHS